MRLNSPSSIINSDDEWCFGISDPIINLRSANNYSLIIHIKFEIMHQNWQMGCFLTIK